MPTWSLTPPRNFFYIQYIIVKHFCDLTNIPIGILMHLRGLTSWGWLESCPCLTPGCSSGQRRTSVSILRQPSWGLTSCVENHCTRICRCPIKDKPLIFVNCLISYSSNIFCDSLEVINAAIAIWLYYYNSCSPIIVAGDIGLSLASLLG